MAPATLAGAGAGAAVQRRAGWHRDSITQAIQEWVATYGEPPRAADWNPSSAKWSGQTWRIERYRKGRADGSPWPALNSAKRPFGGSLSAAIRAAGFEPARPGPVRRKDVRPEQADRAVMSPEARAMLVAALAQEREALRRAASLEARLDRARERADRLAAERDAARAAVRRAPERVDAGQVTRAAKAARAAEARAAKALAALAAAREDVAEARTTAKRLAARLERSEATVAGLRAERRDLRSQLEEARDEVRGLDELLVEARRTARAAADVEPAVVEVPGPDALAVSAARAEAVTARREAAAAQRRAAEAELALRETVAAVRGEPRRLTPEELAELRAAGPAGPAVLAEALNELAAARRRGGEARLHEALRRVAQAAITWQDRL